MERWAQPRLSQHASCPDSVLLGVLRPLPTREGRQAKPSPCLGQILTTASSGQSPGTQLSLLCSLLKSPPGKLEGLRAAGLHSQHATGGGIWLEGSRRGWGEAWLWNIPWEKATAPRPGAGSAGHRDTLRSAAFMWGSWRRGVHERKGLRRMGTERKGQRAWAVSTEDSDPP